MATQQTPTPLQSEESLATPVTTSLQWPLSLEWKRGKDILIHSLLHASSVIINGMVYCGGNDSLSGRVLQYNPESGEWSELPDAPVTGFSLTSFNNQLLLAGGSDSSMTVWDSDRSMWINRYAPMPTRRDLAAAVGFQNYLIVACGFPGSKNVVEVLDSSSGTWYNAQSVPLGGCCMLSVVIGDFWYLYSYLWKDSKQHIFWTHLPTLISNATSAHSGSTTSIWNELPTPPVSKATLSAFRGHLIVVGGLVQVEEYTQKIYRYDLETRCWVECGLLPVATHALCCAALPSGDLMVAGGWKDIHKKSTEEPRVYSKKMWIGTIN